MYDATAGFVAKDYTCSKHNAPLRAIDFSTDNQFVRSNCNAYECLFYSAQDGEHIEQGGTRFRDVPWATESCVLTWACQGVGDDAACGDRSRGGDEMAVATKAGGVKVFRFPAADAGKCESVGDARGHTHNVPSIGWSADDKRIYTVGGGDRAVMTWTTGPRKC